MTNGSFLQKETAPQVKWDLIDELDSSSYRGGKQVN
jgi:hypothetical protein